MLRPRPLLLCLLAGILLTVLTSWAFALFGIFTNFALVAEHERPNRDIPARLIPEGWSVLAWYWWSGPGIRRDLISESPWIGSTLGMMSGQSNRTVITISAGFPCRALA